MMTIVFAVATIICALGWLTRYISCTVMIYYMKKKGYKLPNDEEIRECTQETIRNLLR